MRSKDSKKINVLVIVPCTSNGEIEVPEGKSTK